MKEGDERRRTSSYVIKAKVKGCHLAVTILFRLFFFFSSSTLTSYVACLPLQNQAKVLRYSNSRERSSPSDGREGL
jgi:hypothetical protein